jgi:hypothetical protein
LTSTSDDRVRVAPTLATMAEIYTLSRDGGPRSPRFRAYVARVEHEWGLSAYNPMAGPAALDTVRGLLEMDAERHALEAAHAVAARCEFDGELTLAIVVASKGMWTDRIATEVQHRTLGDRRPAHGVVLLWTGEALDAEIVRRESAAEAVRTMWMLVHGPSLTLRAVLAREGLAYALGTSPFGALAPEDDATVTEALEVLGDTTTPGDLVAVLYGDAAAVTLGHTPLGLADYAGFRWAIARAAEIVARVGPRAALQTSRLPGSRLHGVS